MKITESYGKKIKKVHQSDSLSGSSKFVTELTILLEDESEIQVRWYNGAGLGWSYEAKEPRDA